MTRNLYLAKSDSHTYAKKSCNTCKGCGVVRIKENIKCTHCYNDKFPKKYSICCYCENAIKMGPYEECNICLGSGEFH